NSYGRWRGSCAVSIYNKILIGDAYSGAVGYLDDFSALEFGNTMQVLMIGPVMHNERRRVFHSRFELDMETGVGNTVDPGSDPQVMLDWSDDGGRNFTRPQLWHSLGKIGEYNKRLRWLRLGQARQRMYRLTISDPVRRTVIAA